MISERVEVNQSVEICLTIEAKFCEDLSLFCQWKIIIKISLDSFKFTSDRKHGSTRRFE